MIINEKEIEHLELNSKKIKSIARRLSSAAKDADELGLEVFGGSGMGTLRDMKTGIVLAHLDGNFDGGAGDIFYNSRGLQVGESYKDMENRK